MKILIAVVLEHIFKNSIFDKKKFKFKGDINLVVKETLNFFKYIVTTK